MSECEKEGGERHRGKKGERRYRISQRGRGEPVGACTEPEAGERIEKRAPERERERERERDAAGEAARKGGGPLHLSLSKQGRRARETHAP